MSAAAATVSVAAGVNRWNVMREVSGMAKTDERRELVERTQQVLDLWKDAKIDATRIGELSTTMERFQQIVLSSQFEEIPFYRNNIPAFTWFVSHIGANACSSMIKQWTELVNLLWDHPDSGHEIKLVSDAFLYSSCPEKDNLWGRMTQGVRGKFRAWWNPLPAISGSVGIVTTHPSLAAVPDEHSQGAMDRDSGNAQQQDDDDDDPTVDTDRNTDSSSGMGKPKKVKVKPSKAQRRQNHIGPGVRGGKASKTAEAPRAAVLENERARVSVYTTYSALQECKVLSDSERCASQVPRHAPTQAASVAKALMNNYRGDLRDLDENKVDELIQLLLVTGDYKWPTVIKNWAHKQGRK